MSPEPLSLFDVIVRAYNVQTSAPLLSPADVEQLQRSARERASQEPNTLADNGADAEAINHEIVAQEVAVFYEWVRKNCEEETLLSLFDVLTKEYNSQAVEPQLSPREIFNLRLRAYQRVSENTSFDALDSFEEMTARINDELVATFYKWLHTHRVKRSALCLSGGGIRSGTFALGLIQGLARHNLLSKFDYLSTVSGGGYIGSWLTAWIHREPDGLAGVTKQLRGSSPSSRIDSSPTPIHFLREYSSFLSPEVGLLSADSWMFAGIYIRNLFLNWLVIIPFVIAALTIPRLIVALTMAQPERENQLHLVLNLLWWHPDLYGRHIFLALGFVLGVWTLAYINFHSPGMRETLRQRRPFWWKHGDQRGFLIFCLAPLVASATLLTTYWAWSRETTVGAKDVLPFLLFGSAFTLLAWVVASLILGRLFRWQEINVPELIALLIGGIAAGLFFWIISLQRVGHPVIGYHSNFKWLEADNPLLWRTELYACCGVPLFLLVFLIGATFFVGVSSFSVRIGAEDREWWSRFGAWMLIAIIAWAVVSTLVIFGPMVLFYAPRLAAYFGGISGLIAVLLGRSAISSAKKKVPKEEDNSIATKVGGFISGPTLLAFFLAGFIVAISLLTTLVFQGLAVAAQSVQSLIPVEPLTNAPGGIDGVSGFTWYVQHIYLLVPTTDTANAAKIIHMNILHHTSIWFVLLFALAMFGVGVSLSRVIDLNLFSLRAEYRNRLIRVFLGASRPRRERSPNPFTGFDALDNINMHELRPGLFDESDFLNPVGLAKELQNNGHPLSEYFISHNLLESLYTIPITVRPSRRLTAALHNDLNRILECESLYRLDVTRALRQTNRIAKTIAALVSEYGVDFLGTGAARGDYQLLLNRLILEEAYPNTLVPSRYPLPPYKLLPVINTTLNLVGDANRARQQRKAEPFSISPLHAGCFALGYRESRYYGGRDTGGISLGTAAAISGEAASSNMGYYTTSPVLSLVLTLFNVRLGWWLGNPGRAGKDTYFLRTPKYAARPVLDEVFGLTNDQNKYVYLTDGGHFDNLGLYEMVLRRCHVIIGSDGAPDGDYHFSDLGNALRKIRIDLGVPIEFRSIPISGKFTGDPNGKYWALGSIRYSCIDEGAEDGILLYLKPAVYGNEPRDIVEYKASYPAFPHQSTADQFFDDPQFESYRMLGSFIMDELCGEGSAPLDLAEVLSQAKQKLSPEAVGQGLNYSIDSLLAADG